MLYVIDTDVLTLIEYQPGATVPKLYQRISRQRTEEMCTTIINFQEQSKGCLAAANSAKSEAGLLRAYSLMQRMRDAFCQLKVLPFDTTAKRLFDNFVQNGVRCGTMDLRIAAITLANNAILVTRNTQDFERIPNLKIEDWTT